VPALAGLGVARASAAPQVVLCVLPVAFFAAVLLVAEVPLLARPSPVRWGDDTMFAFIHPTRPPFIGPGGRLRANLACDQLSAEFPGGAEVFTNHEGFRNRREFTRVPGRETRILSMGDSFAAGYAMPQELFFGSQLEKAAQALMPNEDVAVMNAEVSNPAHGLYYLQTYGIQYRPRLVIFALGILTSRSRTG